MELKQGAWRGYETAPYSVANAAFSPPSSRHRPSSTWAEIIAAGSRVL